MDFADALNKMWAKTPVSTRNAIIDCAPKYFSAFDMDEPLVIAHFMAQISHESRNGQIRRESLKYSHSQMMKIFGYVNGQRKHSAGITPEEGKRLVGNEKALAERVYGQGNPKKAKELGNTQPGDGFKYRGNGFLQLTGRYNHRTIGNMIGVDLEQTPELLNNPEYSFAAACAEFSRLGCIPWAKKDNITRVTKLVNGGRNGLAERQVQLRKWKELLDGIENPERLPRTAEVEKAPTLMQTHTGKISAVTGAAATVSVVSQVGEYASSVSDTVTVVADNTVQIVDTVKVVKPFLGMDPHTWMQIGLGASVAVVIGVIFMLIYRYLKIQREAQ